MLIIERLEENIAVIENDGKRFEVSRDKLPKKVREGDILKESDGSYEIDREKTESRRKEILKLQNSLWS